MTTLNFNRYSKYYDLLYAEKDYNKEVSYISDHLRRYKPKFTEILELGSGTGNHAKCFSKAGYTVTGVERSAAMLDISVTKNIRGFSPVLGDMTSFTLGRHFDVAVSLFHSLCYLTTNDELLECFSRVHSHLNPYGIFCFDFWYGPAVLSDRPATRVKRFSNSSVHIVRIAETEISPESNMAIVNYQMIVEKSDGSQSETFYEHHPMRFLSLPELDLLCRQTGFKIVLSETFLEGGVPGLNNWNVFCIIQRQN